MIAQFTVRHYKCLGSTNDEARRFVLEGAPHGTVVHADEQTAGRGRMAHTWFSPPGNLYLSVVLRAGLPVSRSAELSFVTSLAVADTVEKLLPRQISALLKWPNDVLVNGAKISGILLEQVDNATIIGVGLNILQAPATSTYRATTIVANGGIASVDTARDILLERLAHYLAIWGDAGFEFVRHLWLDRTYPIGAVIRARMGTLSVRGQFRGLDFDGALLLHTADGLKRIVAGDIVGIL